MQHAVHVAISADRPMKIAKITSQAPGDLTKLATATFRRTAHESTTLTEYLEYVSSRLCRISSESIMVCISRGDRAEPCRDSWKHELAKQNIIHQFVSTSI